MGSGEVRSVEAMLEERERGLREAATSDTSGCRIPGYMVNKLVAYVIDGRLPGDAMLSLLKHDFRGIMTHCDDENLASLRGWWLLLCNHVPCGAVGSRKAVAAWAGLGGLRGVYERWELDPNRGVKMFETADA